MGMPVEIAEWIAEGRARAQEWLNARGKGANLPSSSDVQKLQYLETRLDRPMPLVYGRHLVAGAPILQHEVSSSDIRLFVALGEGRWYGVEHLWINSTKLTLPDYTALHFHPGMAGEAGTESDPATENQKICSFFPGGLTGMPFSQTAYVAVKVVPDSSWPGPDFVVRGIYQTRRVRTFDASGNQLSYSYYQNPVWQFLDAYIALVIKPEATPGEELTAEEKARIDFAVMAASAAYCNVDIGGGVKRFESNVAFLDSTTFATIQETFCAMCRGYVLEKDNKLGLYIDMPRAAVFLFDGYQIQRHSFVQPEKDLRSLANIVVAKARDTSSGGADPSKDLAPWSKPIALDAALARGERPIKKDMDFGSNTPERCERLATYWLKRSHLEKQIELRGQLDAGMLMAGDVVYAPRNQTDPTNLPLTADIINWQGFDSSVKDTIGDGDKLTQSWTTYGIPSGSWIKFDFGFGTEQDIVRARLFCIKNGTGDYAIQYSDLDLGEEDWTTVASFVPPYGFITERSWESVGAHRYWRLKYSVKYPINDPWDAHWMTELELTGALDKYEITDLALGPEGDVQIFAQEYDETIFSDTADAQQDVEDTTITL